MKRLREKRGVMGLMGVILYLLVFTPSVYAAVPQKINYQGYLTDSTGNPVSGNVSMIFSIYDVPTGGTSLWSETRSVEVSGGIYSLNLGEVTSLNLPFNTQYYLGVKVGADPEMAPRVALTSTPYAIRAGYTDNVELGDNAVTEAKIVDGAIVTSKLADNSVTVSKIGSGQVVKSLNSLKDDVTLSPGTNITITPSGNTLTISAEGGVGTGTITSAHILNGTITSEDISDNAIGTTKLSDNSVTGSKIATNQVVKSINTLKDNVTLAQGSNITITPSGNTLTISSTHIETDPQVGELRAGLWCASNAAGTAIECNQVAPALIGHDHDGAYWKLGGNSGTTPGTHFLGTTDNQALELKVNNARVLRIEPNATSPNLIGGYSGNSLTSGVYGATISGGGAQVGLFVFPNKVTDNYGTIGGGYNNRAGDDSGTTADKPYATVGGGYNNIASGSYSTVPGGTTNIASGYQATIAGGSTNEANASLSSIGGGLSNLASGGYATVGGGYDNTASGSDATV